MGDRLRYLLNVSHSIMLVAHPWTLPSSSPQLCHGASCPHPLFSLSLSLSHSLSPPSVGFSIYSANHCSLFIPSVLFLPPTLPVPSPFSSSLFLSYPPPPIRFSTWSTGNGLRSVIPTLLTSGLLGYPFCLPDMIGGNAYFGRKPDVELLVRWAQANALMPAMQVSSGAGVVLVHSQELHIALVDLGVVGK